MSFWVFRTLGGLLLKEGASQCDPVGSKVDPVGFIYTHITWERLSQGHPPFRGGAPQRVSLVSRYWVARVPSRALAREEVLFG